MVANASTPKKCPANARGANNMQSPVLLSPISVAHRSSSMPEGEGAKKGGNWMRDQWVANLKKKRMANAGNGAGGSGGLQTSASNVRTLGGVRVSPADIGSMAVASRRHNAALEKSINAHHRNQHKHSQFATVDAPLIMSSQLADHDAMHPGMMFNDIGFFEVESQAFAHVLPAPTPAPRAAAPTKARARSGKGGGQKKSAKPLAKKRATTLMLEVNQPKPRTPRRKLNTGDAFFDDYEAALSSSAPTLSSMSMACNNGRPMSAGYASAGYASVGTPSNLNAEVRHMWGPEFDFGGPGNSFADTFLDLPTPKSAEMPFVTASYQPAAAPRAAKSAVKGKRKTKRDAPSAVLLDQPRLVRTNSIEQEGLSHFLEQTNLDGSSGSHGEELFQLVATPMTPGALRQRSKSLNEASLSLSASYDSADYEGYAGYAVAAGAAVNDCFGKLSPMGGGSAPGSLLSTPRGSGLRRTPRGWYAGDFSFDHKGGAPEFETLLDEYKLSDIDQELDSFYLDAMETLGGELDLLSS